MPTAAAEGDSMRFGMDMASIDALQAEDVPPDYAVFWVGSWILNYGWGAPEAHLDKAYAEGVTPVIQFYYWGDSISPTCVESGCNGKSQAGWQELADGLVQRLDTHLKGEPAIIVIETEFNKNGMTEYEPFDAMLAEKARYFESAYPAAETALGFGNWGQSTWGNMDQAMAAMDMASLQAMRGSTRHTADQYLGAADKTLTGAQTLQAAFGKPVLVSDIALSSYPEPEWAQYQDQALGMFFDRIDAFRAAGVVGMIYRTIVDDPDFDLANYFGEAERHWGLTRADGSWKPAMRTWVDGVHAVRSGTSTSGSTTEPALEPATSAPVRFVVLGDFGQDNSGQRAVADAAKATCATEGCDFWVSVGDNIYMSGVDSVNDDKFRTHYEDYYGDIGVPFYMAIGDHDAEGSTQAMVDYSSRSSTWTMPNEWYSHEHGNTLFVTLDHYDISSTQTSWAQRTFDASNHQWKFAVGHVPLVSNGKHGGAVIESQTAEDFIQAAVCDRADLYFSGDDHILAWLPAPDCGATEQVVSGAGAAPRPIEDRGFDAHYEKGDTLGFAWFEVAGGTLTGRFYDDDGTLLHERVVEKETSDGTPAPPQEEPPQQDEPAPAPAPQPSEVTWTLDDDIDAQWVEVYLSPDDATSVETRVNGGDWQTLGRKGWGSWASSAITVPGNATVEFRATFADGTVATSDGYVWPGAPTPEPGHADDGAGNGTTPPNDNGTTPPNGDGNAPPTGDGNAPDLGNETDDGEGLDPSGGNLTDGNGSGRLDGNLTDLETPGPAGVLVALLLVGLALMRRRR